MKTFLQKNKTRWISLISVAIVLFIWFLVTSLGLTPSLYLPGPQDLVDAYGLYSDSILSHIGVTLMRLIVGFVVGSIVGIVIGLLMSASRQVNLFFAPIVNSLRPIPIVALVPLFILWFGIGETGKILLIAFGCFVILIVETLEAVKQVSPIFVDAARTLGATRWQIFRTVIIPGIVPSLVAGIRVAAAASFGLVVASEFLGAQSGLGYMIMMGRRFLRTNVIVLSVIMLSASSFALDFLVQIIGSRLTNWQEKTDMGG